MTAATRDGQLKAMKHRRLTQLLAAGQLVLVAATWKLWTPQTSFPQVPLIRMACHWPAWVDWFALVVMLASIAALLAAGSRNSVQRIAAAGLATSLALFFVLDQHRLQPWAWQFFLLALLVSLGNTGTVSRGWTWLVISIYFWSAFSKLDFTFCHVQGPMLLGGLKRAVGMDGIPNRWTAYAEIAGSLGIAAGELGVTILLMWPKTRWLGLWSATIMHLTLLATLGPFGLNHSAGVLLWNVFFIVQNWLLFSEQRLGPPESGPTAVADSRGSNVNVTSWREWLALGVIIAAIVWPSLESNGRCDHWLAWSVYSARAGHTVVELANDMNLDRIPTSIRERHLHAFVDLPGESNDWYYVMHRRLDTGQWSLQALAVPVLPELRFEVGIALRLREQWGFRGSVIHTPPPSRWNGLSAAPEVFVINDEESLDRLDQRFFWNIRPRTLGD